MADPQALYRFSSVSSTSGHSATLRGNRGGIRGHTATASNGQPPHYSQCNGQPNAAALWILTLIGEVGESRVIAATIAIVPYDCYRGN